MSAKPSASPPRASSPAATGPAGPFVEGSVGAHYLLTLLANANPRGLPGVVINRVEFQRASDGHPLDDVVIRGLDVAGNAVVLEVQVKRSITFAPSDGVYRDVVQQLAAALSSLDLTNEHRQFAVATDRMSSKISGPYQDVLRWARELGTATLFFDRVNRLGVGNDDMRTFVATTCAHLAASGCASDDETAWQILRRLQILTFDFEAEGSQSLELATERARSVLHAEDAARAGALWTALTALTMRSAAVAGEFDRERLVSEISGFLGFRLVGTRRNQAHRQTLREAAALAAADLRRRVGGVSLARSGQLAALRDACELGRYIEIRGAPGVGKSGLLGLMVQQMLGESNAIVLSPERTIGGGWLSFKTALGFEDSPQAFLVDLASGGGSVLFVDSLDFFEDPSKRMTVIDLVRSAAEVPGFRVIATARSEFDRDEPNWLPADSLDRLGRAPPVVIDELGPDEVDELRTNAPTLRALLADDHPARTIARNLFRLSRLLEVQGASDDLRSEGDLLWRWWSTADGGGDGRRERARLLSDLAEAAISGNDHLDTRASADAVEALLASDSLREIGPDRIAFRHDVLREWAVAARLHEDPTTLDRLPLNLPAPASLVRGVELAARLALERSGDGQRWKELIDRLGQPRAHPAWRRHAVLAILRSEVASELLDRAASTLFEEEGRLLREVFRTAIAVESRPMDDYLAGRGITVSALPAGMYGPANGSWPKLALWLVARRADLPLQAVPDVVELFQMLSAALFFLDPITPRMANALADWLDEIELARQHSPLGVDPPRFGQAFRYQELRSLAEDVRQTFFMMSLRAPERASRYLRSLMSRSNADQIIQDLMKFHGSLAQAAPAELAELTLNSLIAVEDEEDDGLRHSIRDEIFSRLDLAFLPSSPAQGPFLDLLTASPADGLNLVRRLVAHTVAVRSGGREAADDGFTLEMLSGTRFFPWLRTYYWSRSADNCSV